jgi:hypothetical protein
MLPRDPFLVARYSIRLPGAGQFSGTVQAVVTDPAGFVLMVVRVRPLWGERYVYADHSLAVRMVSIVRRGRHPLKQHWDLRDLRRGHEVIGAVRRVVHLRGGAHPAPPWHLVDSAGRLAAMLVNRLVHDRDGRVVGASGIDLVLGATDDGRADGRWPIGWQRDTASDQHLDVDCGPVANALDPRLLLCALVIAAQKLPRAGSGRPNPSTWCGLEFGD